jgi:sulfotransferase family protein
MPLPDFFLIGAPKAGTTALHAALQRHPQLFLSRVKEPKFFLCDGRPPPRSRNRGPGDAHSAREWVWRRSDYEALFADAPAGLLRGESTPFYLYDRAAQRRIAAAVPGARLIAVLRDPVERAHSNWMHLRSDGLEPLRDFRAAWAAEDERVAAGWAPFWHYRRLGLYGQQLEHLHTLFPAEQIHVLRYRDLVDAPQETLDAVCRFLGVATGIVHGGRAENVKPFRVDTPRTAALSQLVRAGAAVGSWAPPGVWRAAERPLLRALHHGGGERPRLDPELRQELRAGYAHDNALLGRLTGRSFTDWLSGTGGKRFGTVSS